MLNIDIDVLYRNNYRFLYIQALAHTYKSSFGSREHVEATKAQYQWKHLVVRLLFLIPWSSKWNQASLWKWMTLGKGYKLEKMNLNHSVVLKSKMMFNTRTHTHTHAQTYSLHWWWFIKGTREPTERLPMAKAEII